MIISRQGQFLGTFDKTDTTVYFGGSGGITVYSGIIINNKFQDHEMEEGKLVHLENVKICVPLAADSICSKETNSSSAASDGRFGEVKRDHDYQMKTPTTFQDDDDINAIPPTVSNFGSSMQHDDNIDNQNINMSGDYEDEDEEIPTTREMTDDLTNKITTTTTKGMKTRGNR